MTKMLLCAIATTAAAAILSLALNAGEPEACYDKIDTLDAAVNELKKFRGDYSDEFDQDNHGNQIWVRRIFFANSSLSDCDVLHLIRSSCLDKVFAGASPNKQGPKEQPPHYSLDLSFTRVKGSCFCELRHIKGVEELYLANTLIYDADFQELAQIKNLDYLVLDYNHMRLSQVKQFVRMFNGKEIAFSFEGSTLVDDEAEPDVTPAGCKFRQALPLDLLNALGLLKDKEKLKGLDLTRLGVKDKEIKRLCELFKQIEWLELPENEIPNASLPKIGNLKEVWWLNVTGNKDIKDEGISSLEGLEKLRCLGLGSTGITNEALKGLKLKKIQSLDISNTRTDILRVAKNDKDWASTLNALLWLNVTKTGVSMRDYDPKDLKNLKNLRVLLASETLLTFENVEKLVENIPENPKLALKVTYPNQSVERDNRLEVIRAGIRTKAPSIKALLPN